MMPDPGRVSYHSGPAMIPGHSATAGRR
jgi:hypothetical protein